VPIGQVFGLLWNCSDILPSRVFRQVCDIGGYSGYGPREGEDGPQRQTYGAVARWLKAAAERAEG